MMHICYLTGLYSRKDPLIFDRQGKALAMAGYKVTIVVCDLEPNETIDGIELISCNYKPCSRIERMLNTKKFLYRKALMINADVYQISDPELLSLGIKLKHKGYKVVFNLREFYPGIIHDKAYLPKIARNVIAVLMEKYLKSSLKKYNAVFTVTDDTDNRLEKWGIKNHYVIKNFPVVSSRFTLSKEEYLSRKNVLGYIGTVYWISCQKEVLKALAELPDIKYYVAGVIEEGYVDVLETFPNWKNVDFAGPFKKEEISTVFSKMTISNTLRDFSRTGSPNGSFGVLKIFESMEAGLPVLLSDVKCYREIVEKYNCGICVDPHNSQQIKEAIQYLVENKEMAYQMGQNGRRAVLEEYNWESQAKLYIEVLTNI